MITLTDAQRAALAANARSSREHPGHDPEPVIALINPLGPAMWLATELMADGDTLFGLC